MQRCKYLDDLGIPIEKYGTNFISDDDTRKERWDKQKEEYGFDDRETWNLDIMFIEWIYTRVKMYKEVNVINTEYHKIPYNDTEITQEEAMDKILELAKEILQSSSSCYDDGAMIYNNSREICDLWKEVLPHMWW